MAGEGLLHHLLIDSPIKSLVFVVLALIVGNTIRFIVQAFYNLFFHPLKDIPGPRFAAITQLHKDWYIFKGRLIYYELELFRKYGPIVRDKPNSVIFANPQAWKDIYGHRTGGRPATIKDVAIEPAHEGHEMLEFIPSEEEHGRRRRLYMHAFSDQSIKKQEPMLVEHVDKLIEKLTAVSKESDDPQDLVKWLHFCTFDIMGDLAFGHGMGMVENATYTPWVAAIVGSFKAFTFSVVIRKYQPFAFLMKHTYLGTLIRKAINEHRRFAQIKVDERLNSDVDRPDIWGLVIGADPDRLPSRWAMHEDGMLFMQAGTDTTATLLSGLLWWLLKTPKVFANLREEIRSNLGDEITLEKLARLPYLAACVEEALRIHPPAPPGFTRKAPPGGIAICGRFFREGTEFATPVYAISRYEENFALPDEFHPERWLGDPRFVNDKKDAAQPFLYGPRNCIGKNLAYNEIRLILAKIIVNFDLELDPRSENWMPHDVYGLWVKPPLWIKFRSIG